VPSPSGEAIDEAFGLVLARIRKERGYSQESLGHASDSGRTYISQLERGKRGASLKTLFRLAGQLQMTPSTLVAMVEIELAKMPRSRSRPTR
jgi:transcriptional regulator with XRE-family HTH domain